MKTLSLALVPVALLASVAFGQAPFQINTPTNPTQCIPYQITWTSGGQEPFFLSFNSGNANGPAVQQYQGLTGTSFRWPTNVTSGTTLGLSLTDNNGQTALSAPFTVASGPDSSCLTGGGGDTSAPPTAGQSTTAPGATTPSATAPGATTPSTTAPGATTPTGSNPVSTPSTSAPASGTSNASNTRSSGTPSHSSSGASTTPTGAASVNRAAVGAAGVIGAVVAAIMA